MKDPKPILQSHPSRGAAELLGSARLDTPDPQSMARTLVTLGLAASAATGTSAAAAASAGTVAAGNGAAPVVTVGVLAKWFSVGVLVGTTLSGASLAAVELGLYGTAGDTPHGRPERVVAPRGEPSVPLRIDAPAADRLADTISSQRHTEAAAGTRRAPSASSPAIRTTPRLAEEVQALDAVRVAVGRGDTATALRLLEAFDARFPRPRLGPEAAVLRVEVLVAAGRTDEARRLGQELREDVHGGAHIRRLQRLLDGSESTVEP